MTCEGERWFVSLHLVKQEEGGRAALVWYSSRSYHATLLTSTLLMLLSAKMTLRDVEMTAQVLRQEAPSLRELRFYSTAGLQKFVIAFFNMEQGWCPCKKRW